jgi:bifunctional non-homologous end joining protein LigD
MASSKKNQSSPAFVIPMAAVAVKQLPEGEEWFYEVKFDGYRALVIKDGAWVEIQSRNHKNLTAMYPTVTSAASRLGANQAVIDGEIVALDERGRPAFQALQHRSSHLEHQIVFYAFDVLHVEGCDITGEPIEKRRALLPKLVGTNPVIRISAELPGSASKVIDAVRSLGLEGVIAKRRGSVYQPDERSSDWLKLKLENQQEFVIGGFRPDGASIDALLVGYYQDKELKFAAKVRAGFTVHIRRQVRLKLDPLRTARCPFTDLPATGSSRWGGGVTADQMHEMVWVRPELVAQFRFVEWTAEGRLRHAAFLGMRSDKSAADVHRES